MLCFFKHNNVSLYSQFLVSNAGISLNAEFRIRIEYVIIQTQTGRFRRKLMFDK